MKYIAKYYNLSCNPEDNFLLIYSSQAYLAYGIPRNNLKRMSLLQKVTIMSHSWLDRQNLKGTLESVKQLQSCSSWIAISQYIKLFRFIKDVIIQPYKHLQQDKIILQFSVNLINVQEESVFGFSRITNIYWFIEDIFVAGFLQNWWPFYQRTHNTTSHFAMPFVSSWSGC